MVKKFFASILVCALIILGCSWYIIHHWSHTAPAPIAEQTKLTLIEGWTTDDMAHYIERQGIVTAKDFLAAEKNMSTSGYPILTSKPSKADLEGFLFPDTYNVLKNASGTPDQISKTIIKKTLDNFSKKFSSEMQQQAASQGPTVFQVVTLASIVEKETGRNAVTPEQKNALDTERKIVAGIFFNRLAINMPLASDATINFITKKNTPSASISDTQIESPYNTYRNTGLPPGPICNPSLASLQAVLNPTKTNYYFFLHKQPSGEPVYSKTFAEHEASKQKYLK